MGRTGIGWRVLAGMLALAAAVPATAAGRFAGPSRLRVVDAVTGAPVAGVAIWSAGGPVATTGAEGAARLDPPAGSTVRLSRPGYEDARVVVGLPGDTAGGPLEVALLPAGLDAAGLRLADLRIRAPGPRPAPPPLEPVTIEVPATLAVRLEDGSIEEMDLEEYVKGVLPKEIGTSFPAEAMKAQAVAARTYALVYVKSKGSICTTTQCQVWGPTHYPATDAAVEATRGVVAAYGGKMVSTYFAASCGGHTLNVEEVWSGPPQGYLVGVPCIENRTGACTQTCDPATPKDAVCWGVNGHRIGLCQRGAEAMGRCGSTWDEILGHYYTGIQLANRPEPAEEAVVDAVEAPPEPAPEPAPDASPEPAPDAAATGDPGVADPAPADATADDGLDLRTAPVPASGGCAAGSAGPCDAWLLPALAAGLGLLRRRTRPVPRNPTNVV